MVLPDGTEQSGQVSAASGGTATVTLSDETALPGDTAEVLLDGESAGSGTLYIHSELRVTGFAGTVSRVNVTLNAPVSASNNLITLTGTGTPGATPRCSPGGTSWRDELQALFTAYETGGVYADSAGRVSGLNEDILTEDGDSAGSTDASVVTASAMSYTGAAYAPSRLLLAAENKRAARLLLLSDTGSASPVSPSEDDTSGSEDSGDSGGGSSSSGGETPAPGTTSAEYIGRVSSVTDNGDGTHTLVISYDGGELTVSTADLTGKTGSTDPLGIKQGDILALRFENGALVSASVYQSSSDTPSGDGAQPGADSAMRGMSGGMGGMAGGMAGGTDASGAAQSERRRLHRRGDDPLHAHAV